MAKMALIERELKRDKLVAKYAKKHAELKGIANDAKRGDDERRDGAEQHVANSDGVILGMGSRGLRRSTPNVRAKRATTAGRQARAGENVPRTARPGLVACRWGSA